MHVEERYLVLISVKDKVVGLSGVAAEAKAYCAILVDTVVSRPPAHHPANSYWGHMSRGDL